MQSAKADMRATVRPDLASSQGEEFIPTPSRSEMGRDGD